MSKRNSDDPLTALRGDDRPVRPDPAFAARLRSRLEALAGVEMTIPIHTEGVLMRDTATIVAPDDNRTATAPRPAALPYLAVGNARDALAWYADALGATVVGEPIVMDDGRIGHAEMALAGGVLYLADEFPELGLKAPEPQAVSVSLMLHVADTDRTLDRARDHGARVEREPYENYGARNATIVDPFGHRWMLSGPTDRIRHGDVGYVSVWTPDAQRAARFYEHVLGWQYDPTTHEVTNTRQSIGIFEVVGRRTLFCCYAVDDLQAARTAILDGGGTVDDVQRFDFGEVLGATDALGTEFAVFLPDAGTPRPARNGTGHGELAYLTHEVTDSAVFKDFYRSVLAWTFEPGSIDDGWQVTGPNPMNGVAGGKNRPLTVPMWSVDDVDAAVGRVRDAGGTVVQEPTQQPYGRTAFCTDDQGSRFDLGEI